MRDERKKEKKVLSKKEREIEREMVKKIINK